MAGPVDELVDEFLALSGGGRVPPRDIVEAEPGTLEFCGEDAQATLTFVRHETITLLAVGTREETVEFFEEKQRDRGRSPRFAWARRVQAAGAVWGGELRGFRPLGSGRVLGVIEREQAALVLGLVGKNCVVVLVEGRQRTLICVSPWQQLGIVDLDVYLKLLSRKRPAVQVSAQEVSDRICVALRALAARAMGPSSERHRGKKTVGHFIEVLLAIGQAGCGDLTGRACDIVVQIERYLPNEVLCPRQVGRVLALLEETATVLVERPTLRTWRIRLADLQSPSSAIHKAVCADIPRRRLVPSSPHQAPARPPTAGEMLRAGLDPDTLASAAASATSPSSAAVAATATSAGSAAAAAPTTSPGSATAAASAPAQGWRVSPPGVLEALVAGVGPDRIVRLGR